jgi:hypothetical protein
MESLTGQALAAALQKPFEMDDIEWKAQASGKNDRGFWVLAVPYIKARAIRDRLDEVVGPENWKPERYEAGAAGGLQCGLSLRIHGEWITKWDGAENTDYEAIKGGISDAFKRVARVWGIGRYLERATANFAEVVQDGTYKANVQDGNHKQTVRWNPPGLPAFCWPNAGRVVPPKPEQPIAHSPESSAAAEEAQELRSRIEQTLHSIKEQNLKMADNKSAYLHFHRELFTCNGDPEKLKKLESAIYYFMKNGELEAA